MFHVEAVICVLGIVSAAIVCCCVCFCRIIKRSPADLPSPEAPSPEAPAGPVYFYDMTQVTAHDDSAPPPYHLAALYPPVICHQQMTPHGYIQATLV